MARADQFFPGVIDYDEMSTSYQSGRALTEDAGRTWSALLAPFVPPGARILDLGAGAGRFATLFAQSIEAKIIGIEPSKGMLAVAREKRLKNLSYLAGSAERIPLAAASCDVAWMSHVWHHIRDRQACVGDLRRVMRREGHVLVRGTFADQMDGFPTLFRFWPGTRAICQQLPTIPATTAIFEANGFKLAEHRRVQQQTAASFEEFAERTRLRADTALALISDSEFQKGQLAIEAAAAAEEGSAPVMEIIELLVFRPS